MRPAPSGEPHVKWIVALAILIELPLLYLFIGLTGTATQSARWVP